MTEEEYLWPMKPESFNEEYLTRKLQECSTPGEVYVIKDKIIEYFYLGVLSLWETNQVSTDLFEEKKISLLYNGKTYLFNWYGDSGCLEFEEDDWEFICRLYEGGVSLETLLEWIDKQRMIVRKIMPVYQKAKGKTDRLYGIQIVGITNSIKRFLDQYGITARLEVREQCGPEEKGWVVKMSGYKSDRDSDVSFQIADNFQPWEIKQILEPLFRFFSLDYCIRFDYRKMVYSYCWRSCDSAPIHAFPFFYAVLLVNYDLSMSMFSNGDENQVLVELQDRKDVFFIDKEKLYFEFDFRKYSLNDFRKVIKMLDMEIFDPITTFRNAGNHTDASILIDFQSALLAANK